MKLFVVVLCYRVVDLTIDCLRSLSGEIGRVPGTKVGLLENGTGGDSAERLRQGHPGERLEFVGRPHRGVSQPGIHRREQPVDPPGARVRRSARLRAPAQLGHDRQGTCPRCPGRLHGQPSPGGNRRQPDARPDGRGQGFAVPLPGNRHRTGSRPAAGNRLEAPLPWGLEPPKPRKSTRVDWVSGASMILRRTMLEEIGLLDEGLYTYFDDIDICLRAQQSGMGDVVRRGEPGHPSGWGIDRGDREGGQPPPGLLVRGPATVLLEELRQALHGPDRRDVHPGMRALAAPTAGSSARRILIRSNC